MSDIVSSALLWGSLDIEWLNNFIDEHNLDSDKVCEYKNDATGCKDVEDINIYIHSALEIAYNNFKQKVEEFAKEEFMIDFENGIYCNYLDSGYDSILNEFDLVDFSEENIKKFIIEFEDI